MILIVALLVCMISAATTASAADKQKSRNRAQKALRAGDLELAEKIFRELVARNERDTDARLTPSAPTSAPAAPPTPASEKKAEVVPGDPWQAYKANALKAYLTYMLTDGQKLLEPLDFAPLPKALADKAMAQVAKIQSAGA